MENLDNPIQPQIKSSIFNYAIKWALVLSLLQIVYSLVVYLIGQTLNPVTGWLQYIVIIAFGTYATINFRNKERGGALTFGEGFGVCFQLILFAGIITAIYFVFIFIQFIDPGFVDETIRVSQQKMIDKGMTDDQIEMALKYTKMFMKPGIMFVFAIVGSAFMGAILSLIVAAISRKENNVLLPPQ
jgi:hypothetical protein